MAKKNEQYDSHVQNMIKVGSPRKSARRVCYDRNKDLKTN